VDQVLEHGARASDEALRVYLLPNQSGRTRFGVRVPRRVGSAVVRNRIRRRLREIFRRYRDDLPEGVDLLCTVKAPTVEPFQRLRERLTKLVLKADRLRRPARPKHGKPRTSGDRKDTQSRQASDP